MVKNRSKTIKKDRFLQKQVTLLLQAASGHFSEHRKSANLDSCVFLFKTTISLDFDLEAFKAALMRGFAKDATIARLTRMLAKAKKA